MSEQAPRLPRAIADRIAGLRLHRDTLLYAMEQIGAGFPRERFVAAAMSRDPARRAHVLAVERGFEVLTNTMAELAAEGLAAAGAWPDGEEVTAPRAFRGLRDEGGISAALCERLLALQRTRNDLQHDYPAVQAHALHAGLVDLLDVLPAFFRSYEAWLRTRVVGRSGT